jgi:anti-anti-sigma factor
LDTFRITGLEKEGSAEAVPPLRSQRRRRLFRERTGCPVPPRERHDTGRAGGWSLDAEQTSPERALVRAAGEFDLAAVDDVHRAIGAAAAALAQPATVVVDLSAVTFLDAAMLGALVTERRAMQAAGGDLQLVGVSAWAMRIIDICGLRQTLGL